MLLLHPAALTSSLFQPNQTLHRAITGTADMRAPTCCLQVWSEDGALLVHPLLGVDGVRAPPLCVTT